MKERKRDVYYWQERTILKNLNMEWQEHAIFKFIDKQGIQGVGAATPNYYFGETFKTTMAILELIRDLFEMEDDIENIPNIEEKFNEKIKRDNSSKTAVFLAIFDYLTNKYNYDPINLLFPTKKGISQESLFRIFWKKDTNIFDLLPEIQKDEEIVKIEFLEKPLLSEFEKILKLFKNKKLWIDLRGLFPQHEIRFILKLLKSSEIMALEQPTPKYKENTLSNLQINYPIFWDESIEQPEDIIRVSNIASGVVLDITKVGGLTNLKKHYDLANTLNLETVISTRIEHPINLNWSNKIKKAFDIIDLNIDHYIVI